MCELGWEKYRIGELGKVITGRTPPSSNPEYFGDKYPFITPSDMQGSSKIYFSERYLSDSGAVLLKNNLIPANSVAVSCIGWQMGKAILTTRPSFTNQQLNTIIPNSKVDPAFLYYVLLTKRQELFALGAMAGVRTPILNKSAFSEFVLLLPSLPHQKEISSILSAYDDLIENNTRRIRILEEMAQAIYREWFVHFRYPGHEGARLVESEVGGIPEGWEAFQLGQVIEFAYGKGLKEENRIPGNIPVFGSAGIVGYHSEALVMGPGIIVGRKGNVGSVFWSDEDFFPIDTVFYIKTDLSLYYSYFNLRTQNFINNDAAVPGLSRNQAYTLPIVIPSRTIMDHFDQLMKPIFRQVRVLTKANANLRQQRDLLLPRLVSGELDVRNR